MDRQRTGVPPLLTIVASRNRTVLTLPDSGIEAMRPSDR